MGEATFPATYDTNSPYGVRMTEDSSNYIIQHIQLTDDSSTDPELIYPAVSHRSDHEAAAVSVTDSEVELTAGLTARKTIALYNMDSSNTVYLGKTGVADTTGYPLPPETSIAFDSNAVWYGICGAGLTAEVRVLELK